MYHRLSRCYVAACLSLLDCRDWSAAAIVLWILAWLLTARLMSRLLNRPPVGDPALDAGAYDEVEGGSEMSNVLSVGFVRWPRSLCMYCSHS